MSTRSVIGKKIAPDTVQYVYCHFDGDINGVGQDLLDQCTNEQALNELLARGDCDDINSPFDSDGHARSTEWHQFRPGLHGAEYVYLFENNEWYFLGRENTEFELVKDHLNASIY